MGSNIGAEKNRKKKKLNKDNKSKSNKFKESEVNINELVDNQMYPHNTEMGFKKPKGSLPTDPHIHPHYY